MQTLTSRESAFISWNAALLVASVMLVATAHAATISTFAGTGVKGFSGDGGPASAAQLNNPFAVARGPDGALYICDVDNQRIRRVTSDGKISTYAGNGQRGYSGDGGSATNAALNEPYEMAWDKAGNLFFVERLNHLVRRSMRRPASSAPSRARENLASPVTAERRRPRSSTNRTAWPSTRRTIFTSAMCSIIASAKST